MESDDQLEAKLAESGLKGTELHAYKLHLFMSRLHHLQAS